MTSEEERVRQLIQDLADGRDDGNKLVIDQGGRQIRAVPRYADPDGAMVAEAEDADVYALDHDLA